MFSGIFIFSPQSIMAAIVMRIAVDGRIPVSNPIQGFEKGKPMLINISAAAMVPKMMRVVNERSPPKRIKRRKQAMMGIKMILLSIVQLKHSTRIMALLAEDFIQI